MALGPLDGKRLSTAFHELSASVGERIRKLYRSPDDKGRLQDVLYFFWVKQATCPRCESSVDLFPTRIVARNADPARKPQVQVCCPQCGDIFAVRCRDEPAKCPSCRFSFDPCRGTATGTSAKCPECAGDFAIAQAVRSTEHAPAHRLYAKLLLYPDGTKRYLPGTDDDYRAYLHCSQLLADELRAASSDFRLRFSATVTTRGRPSATTTVVGGISSMIGSYSHWVGSKKPFLICLIRALGTPC